jgi:hypothetical protein
LKEFKLLTKFIQAEESPREEKVQYESPSVRESVYLEAEEEKSREESLGLEEDKKNITMRNRDLVSQNDKRKAEIDNARHKLKFSRDSDIALAESASKYGMPHLVFMFFVGLLIGYYVLG